MEVFVKYDSFNSYSRVFDFGGIGSKTGGENIILANEGASSTIMWEVSGSEPQSDKLRKHALI